MSVVTQPGILYIVLVLILSLERWICSLALRRHHPHHRTVESEEALVPAFGRTERSARTQSIWDRGIHPKRLGAIGRGLPLILSISAVHQRFARQQPRRAKSVTRSNHIYEGTRQNFVELVLDNSSRGPVLVNFWAEWAGPCHRLFPVLATLANDYGGRFLLVNVNTDEEKAVATEYGVKSLPLVKVFVRGKVVEEVHGYQPEPDLRRLIDRHVTKPSDQRIADAVRRYQGGDTEGGLQLLAQAALEDPANFRIPAVLGKLLMAQRRFDEAENLFNGLPAELREQPEISHLVSHLGFIQVARSAPDRAALETRLAADPADAEARHQLAAVALVEDDYDMALTQLLELVRHDRHYGDDAGRRGMLAVFKLLGDDGELVERYRALMYSALH